MFSLFKKRNEKSVGIKNWAIDPGPGFRIINNEDSIQYVNEDESRIIYLSVLIVQGNSPITTDVLSEEPKITQEKDGWQLKGVKKASGQLLVCLISLKYQADTEWATNYFETLRELGT